MNKQRWNSIKHYFLLFCTFLIYVSANQNSYAGSQKAPATTLLEHKIDFLWLIPCNHDNKQGVCIVRKLPPGKEITVLKKGELCIVKTTNKKAIFEDEDQMDEAYQLINVDCKIIPYHVRGITGRTVSDYQELSYQRVTDAAVIERIEKGMRDLRVFKSMNEQAQTDAAIKKMLAGHPMVFKYPHPSADIYLAHYNDLLPLVAVVNGEYHVLAQGQHGCCKDGDAFRMNHEYYVMINVCGTGEEMTCDNKSFKIMNNK